MLDIDLPYFWRHGFLMLSGGFIPSGLLTKYFLLRSSTALPPRSCLAADAAMNVGSWMFVVAFPVVLFVWAAVHIYILDRIPTGRADPFSWICVLLVSALIAAATEAGVLRVFFKQKLHRAALGLLLLINVGCVAGAAYAAAKYVLAHPTE